MSLLSNTLTITKVLNGTPGTPGAAGANGYNAATIYIYLRAASLPSEPTGNLTYIFDTGVLTSTDPSYFNGWSLTMPANSTNPCWVGIASAISNTSDDIIEPNDWVIRELVENGAPGATGVSITGVVEEYAINNSNTTAPTSGWSTSLVAPTSQNRYLWNREVISYSNGNSTTVTPHIAGMYSEDGVDGKGISSIVNTYAISNDSSTAPTSGWSNTPMAPTSSNKYLWNKEVVNYTTGDPTTTIRVIGTYSEDGAPGLDGYNLATIYLYLRATSEPSVPTNLTYKFSDGTITGNLGSWTRTIPTGTNPCWVTSAVVVSRNDNNNALTFVTPAIMTLNGRGVYSVVEYYKANNDSTVAPSGTWGNSVLTPTELLPYVWNYEVVTYTDGTTSETNKHIVAMYGASGAAGRGISDIEDLYAKSSTTTAPADNLFSTTIPTLDETNKYLWNREKITYTDNTYEYTSKRIIGMYSKDGTSVTVTNTYYGTSNSSSTLPSSWTLGSPTNILKGVWLWIKTVFSDTSNVVTCSYTGNDGLNGASVSIYNLEIAYQASNSGDTIPTGTWQPTVSLAGASAGQFLWTRTIVNYTTNGTTVSSTTTSYSVSRIGSDGAQGPAGLDGLDGTSVSIYSLEIVYLASSSGDTTPTGTWSSTVAGAGAQAGQFLWTRTTVNYTTDGTTISNSTVSYSVSRIGTNGTNGLNGVNSAILYIYLRKSGTAPAAPTNDVVYVFANGDYTPETKGNLSPWQMTIPTNNGNPCYVATAAAISSSDRDTILGTNAGLNCDWTVSLLVANGTNGVSVTGVVEEYALGNDSSTAPTTGWDSSNIPTPTSSLRYLWNREVISYSSGNSTTTDPHIASMYAQDGAAGRGISSITNKYAINNNSGTAPTTWENSPMAPTSSNPYLWNQEIITYTSGSPATTTTTRIIGTYSEDGYNLATVYVYKRSSTPLDSNTYTPTATGYTFSTKLLSNLTTGWNLNMPLAGSDPCYISCAVVMSRTDSTNSVTFVTPAKLVENGLDGTSITITSTTHSNGVTTVYFSDGTSITIDDGADGKEISTITEYYQKWTSDSTAPTGQWSTSVVVPDEDYPYLWNYEIITYSNNTTSETSKRVIGMYSAPGADGKGISSITNYYKATPNTTVPTTGWVTSPIPIPDLTNKYLWNYEHTVYTDNTTSDTTAHIIGMYGEKGDTGDTGAQGPQGPAGLDGVNGYNYIILYYYIRSADTPTKPLGTYAYNFEDKSISPSINNWQLTIPPVDGNPCWVTTISFLGNTNLVSGQSFTDPVKFVVDGEDANLYTIRTGTEEVLKFVKSGSTYNNKTYDFSPEEFSFYGFDIKGQSFLYNQLHDSDKYCTLTILIDNYKLSDVIKAANYSTYVYTDNSNYINYNFNIGALYTAYLNGLSSLINTSYSSSEKLAILDAIGNFFSNTSQSLSFVIVGKVTDGADSYNIEKYISVKNGLAEEMMNFSINAGNITAAILDAGLKFGSDGLTVTNTGFKIQSDADGTLKNVFYVDSDTHLLIMNGNGTFTGTVYAEDGSFKGTVTAARGSIGGFNITDNSIESWTKNLGLFSLISVDPGIVEQGSIVNHVDSDSNYRLRTDYISILPGLTYIINTNIEYVYVHSYSSNTSSSFVSASGWKSGVNYSYTAPSTANYIRIVLAKNTGTTTTLVSPTDVSYFTIMQEDSSLIKVENIKIGDGGEVDGYLRVGNLSLINPDKSEDNAVIKLEVPNDGVYFKLTNEGYIEGNNWSIKKEPGNNYVIARFGKLIAEDGEFNGTIHATDGTFTGTVVSSIISASTINTANFITENTRSLGGSFVFKPTFEINSITDKGSNVLEFNLANASEYFKFGVTDTIDVEIPDNKDGYYIDENGVDTVTTSQGCIDLWIKVTPNLTYTIVIMPGYKAAKRIHEYSGMDEVGGAGKPSTWLRQKWSKASSSVTTGSLITATITVSSDANYIRISRSRSDTVTITRVPDLIVSISGVDCRYGTITAIDTSNNMCKISANFKTTDYNILKVADALSNYQTLTLFGKDNNDLLIGINSDDLHAGDILPPRALTMETFSKVIDANGTGNLDYNINLLLGDLNSLKEQSSKFNYVKGYGLYADNVYLHGSLMTENGAGSYAGVHTTKDLDFSYASWGGENTDSYAGEKIIFWGGSNSLDDIDIQTSPFIVTDKGSIFANRGEFKGTVITNSLISNARIETPIIYGTGNNPSLRIYDTDNSKMGIGFYKADETLTLNISNIGFSHYYNNILTSFIQFSDNDNSIYFTGTSFTAGNTIYSSLSILDGLANILINGNSGGNVKLVYNTNSGVEVTEGLVRNFGGQVVNEGTMQIVDNTKYLKYTVNNGYYCLYVES